MIARGLANAVLIGLFSVGLGRTAPAQQPAKELTDAEVRDVVAKDMNEVARVIGEGKSTRDYLSSVAGSHLLFWRKGETQGLPEAAFLVAQCYFLGLTVPVDYAEAVRHFRTSAGKGCTVAQCNLGYCYETGKGVVKDPAEAAKWYRKSADGGDRQAQHNLASCYSAGRGVARDPAEALKWYRKAAEQGAAEDQHSLGGCLERGIGTSRDEAQAVKWYRKAAVQGYIQSQHSLAMCCEDGRGTTKDPAEAAKWYRKAAELGLAASQHNYGILCQAGLGVPKDEAEAVRWYLKAAAQGLAASKHRLAICNEYGIGVAEDRAEAERWRRTTGEPPLPVLPNAVDSLTVPWMKRVILGPYVRKPAKDPAWSEAGRVFLQHICEDDFRDPQAIKESLRLGRKAVDAGCDDPMVLYWYNELLVWTCRNEGDPALVQAALKGFEGGQYSVDFACRAVRRLLLTYARETAEKERLNKLAQDLLVQTICKGPYLPGEHRLLLSEFHDILSGNDSRKLEPVYNAVKDVPGADPWTVAMLAGRLHIRKAWDVRGGDYASKVSDKQWEGFEEHLAVARESLTKAWRLNPKAPEAAVQMIVVAMGHGDTEGVLAWFRRAVEAQFDCPGAYQAARWALRPRWGGSHEMMMKLGIDAVESGRYDTNVPFELLWVAEGIAGDLDGGWAEALATPGLYGRLQTMLDGYMAAAPKLASWAYSYKAALAWRTGRWADARGFVDKAGKDMDLRTFAIVGGSAEALKEIDRHAPPVPAQKAP